MTTFTWLHLSDLHLKGDETSVHRKQFEDMLSDIEKQQKALKPDVVFFTGDVAYGGQRAQYEQAAGMLDQILEACGLKGQRNRMFIVPGNHDVNREQKHWMQVLHQDLAKRLLNDDEDEVNRFLSSKDQKDIDDRQSLFMKLEDYDGFLRDFFADTTIRLTCDRLYAVSPITKGPYTIVVIGLNTAWFSFQNDEQGCLLLGEIQVLDAFEEANKKWPNARLHIALVHHPIYWLAEKEIQQAQQRLPGKCDMLLRGHLHCPSFSIQTTPDSHLCEFAAGASLKAPYHAYNLVQLNLNTGEGIAIVRLQHPKNKSTWGDDSFTYRNAEGGRIRFQLHLRGERTPEA